MHPHPAQSRHSTKSQIPPSPFENKKLQINPQPLLPNHPTPLRSSAAGKRPNLKVRHSCQLEDATVYASEGSAKTKKTPVSVPSRQPVTQAITHTTESAIAITHTTERTGQEDDEVPGWTHRRKGKRDRCSRNQNKKEKCLTLHCLKKKKRTRRKEKLTL